MKNKQIISWGTKAEQEESDRSYYERLDAQEEDAKINERNVIELRRQTNHLAAQTVRLQKENEDLKRDYVLAMESNKQCAQANIDLHQEIQSLKYKADMNQKDMIKKLAAWVDVNTILSKKNEVLQKDQRRNEQLEGIIHALELKLAQSENCKTINNKQVVKLQTSDMAFRKIIDFYKTAVETLKETLVKVDALPLFAWRQKGTAISHCKKTIQVIEGQIFHEFAELLKNTQIV